MARTRPRFYSSLDPETIALLDLSERLQVRSEALQSRCNAESKLLKQLLGPERPPPDREQPKD